MDTDEIAYRPGDVLAGKYKVERVIGLGGFGAVLSATHLQLEERVAIKVLLPHAAKNAAAAERFLREARAAVRIRSEHVARVTDVGKLHDTVPYMVMEFLEGQDLSAVLKSQGCQPVTDVVEWVLQACEALAEAHSLGIVHRDLKPANLFLTRKVDGAPCIKVLDFGISKMTSENGDKGMTKTSDVMGSPFYMSPEQMRSTRSVDARSDIWALGAILFEMLAGAPPFDAETMTALVVSIMQEPPRDLGLFRRDIPPAVRDIIMRCLQKDPAQRFPDVAALAGALAAFAPQRAQINLQRVMAISGRASNPLVPGRASAVPGSGPQPQPEAGVSGNLTMAGGPASLAFGQSGQGPHQSQNAHAPSGPYGHHDSGGYMQQPAMGVSYGSDPGQMGPGMVGPTQPGSYGPGFSSSGNPPPGMLHMHAGASPAQSWGGTYMGTKKQSGSKAALIVGVIALGVVLIGGGGGIYYVVTNDDKPTKHARNNGDDEDEDTVSHVTAANAAPNTTSASATASASVDSAKPAGSEVVPVMSSAPATTTSTPPTPSTPTSVASSSPPAPSSAPGKPTVAKPQPTPEPTLPPIIIVPPTQTQPPPPPPPKTNRPPNNPLFGQPD